MSYRLNCNITAISVDIKRRCVVNPRRNTGRFMVDKHSILMYNSPMAQCLCSDTRRLAALVAVTYILTRQTEEQSDASEWRQLAWKNTDKGWKKIGDRDDINRT